VHELSENPLVATPVQARALDSSVAPGSNPATVKSPLFFPLERGFLVYLGAINKDFLVERFCARSKSLIIVA